jgi:rhodanese-related sulfurtransferase
MFLKSFAELPARKRVGIVAIILGILSIFAGNPSDNVNTKINIKELSLISPNEISKVGVNELADWIIKGKYDYRLVDLRESEKFLKYNIPTSENIGVTELLKSDLSRNENIILYSDNDIVSTQGWFTLKSKDYKGVYIIEGGIKTWEDEILFPTCTCGESPSTEQKHKHNKLAEVSKFFGGQINSSGESVSEQSNRKMPEISAPVSIELKKPKGKRKREGC